MIYLASPYSHRLSDVRRKRFEDVCKYAAQLMAKGHVVFSPVAHSHPIAVHGKLPEMAHNFWLGQDLPLLRKSDYLIVLKLKGWHKSRGIKAEIDCAHSLGIPVYYHEPTT